MEDLDDWDAGGFGAVGQRLDAIDEGGDVGS
jgi:hypothetical protein